ncbi:MAG TPA: hypothetical protein PK874_14845 [Desulfobacteraceae bacterium]|nr:hypothetical protein [Desulfobacteraceae bacterium]HPJ68963.1 hypothetical protein [Desulfobacteraceae bacterium]HPQ29952.1 hypothetical protein [Desulfobacteraceae bacterium]
MRSKPTILLFLCLCLFVVLYAAGFTAVKGARQSLGVNYRLDVSPLPPDLLKIFSGEFRGLVADYILLEIASFVGSNKKISNEEWNRIVLAFEQSLNLDPYFEQTYVVAQGLLPWEAKLPEKAISLLDISRKHRPWDWRPGYYMAFDWYYFLHDYAKASEAFLEAAKIKGAPVLLAVLGGRFALKGGRTQAAIVLLQAMLNDPDMDEYKEKEITDRIDALKGVMLLESALKKFKEIYNYLPDSLYELIEKGFLEQLPENPYADRYFYSKDDGRVFFDTIK